MFQLDENFLNDLGLGDLPADQKQAFLQTVFDRLELAVGTKLSEGLSESQMQEFESFIDQDETKVRAWFEKYLPNYQEQEDYQKLLSSIQEQKQAGTVKDVAEIAILSEYGSLKWLEKNRPDYRQVVASELEMIKQEILKNRDAILGLV